MNYYTKDHIISMINEMTIREKDYPIMMSLLNTKDPNLISAILEEILKGNLYWSDLQACLPENKYDNILSQTLPTQKALMKRVSAMITLNKFRKLNEHELNNLIRNTAIINVPQNDKIYNEEKTKARDDLITSLYNINSDDTSIERSSKIALMNMVMNAEFLKSLSKEELSEKYYIYNNTVRDKTTNAEYKFIDPDDILLWASEYIVPVDETMIVLTDWDVAYMKLHNLTEEMIKKIISVSRIITHKL